MTEQELKFNLKLQEVPVKIIDIDGQEKTYKLCELTGEQRDTYLNHFDISMKMVDGEPQLQTGENFKAFSAVDFLAMCLYDETGKLVPIANIKKFPASVIAKLHKVAQTLSGLDERGTEEAKND